MLYVDVAGEAVPALGLGTWDLAPAECEEAVRDALSIGYRHIDTAAMYGNEEAVGKGLRRSGVARREVFVTTKVWLDDHHPRDLPRAAEQSLRRLRLDEVDLLLLHWPHPDIALEDTLEALVKLQEAGKTRLIGVSNFPPSWVERALEVAPVACNQVEYHPYLSQDDLLEQARGAGLLLTAYRPVAAGAVADDPVLEEIGAGYGKSPFQVALRWLIEQERVAAIPRSSDPGHRRANFDLWDFELSAEERERIRALDRGERLVDPDFGPDWER